MDVTLKVMVTASSKIHGIAGMVFISQALFSE